MDTPPCPAVVAQHPRAEFGLSPRRRSAPLLRHEGVVVHCSAGRQPVDARDSAKALRIMQAWHFHLGWADVGYSWAFDDLGHVWELRGWGRKGSHTKADPDGRGSLNGRAHGFVYLGNGLRPTAAALEAGAWLVAESERQYGPGFVIGHREVSAKRCPGDGVFTGLVLPLGRPLVAR